MEVSFQSAWQLTIPVSLISLSTSSAKYGVWYEGLKLSTESSAHPAVEEEVHGGVEDEEDVVEMRDTKEPGGYTMPSMPETQNCYFLHIINIKMD